MIKYISLLTILAIRLFYQPSATETHIAPFAVSPVPLPAPAPAATAAARLLEFKGRINNNKVILNWVVEENETADLFEVEKSTDGVTFKMAALVFGTDKSATGNYEFYEKAGNQRVQYRIKLVNKNKKAEYSPVVEINPVV
jgi:hypothetical protein